MYLGIGLSFVKREYCTWRHERVGMEIFWWKLDSKGEGLIGTAEFWVEVKANSKVPYPLSYGRTAKLHFLQGEVAYPQQLLQVLLCWILRNFGWSFPLSTRLPAVIDLRAFGLLEDCWTPLHVSDFLQSAHAKHGLEDTQGWSEARVGDQCREWYDWHLWLVLCWQILNLRLS